MKSTLNPSSSKTSKTAALAFVLAALAFVALQASSLTAVAQTTASGTTKIEKSAAPSTAKAADGAYASASSTAAAAAPKVGEAAPDFKLPYATAEKIFFRDEERMTLSSQKGKNVILAFYPADWSGGCTTEVCTFRDTFMEFGKFNAVVFGISGDYVFSHHEWAKHHKLPFALLSDHDHSVARAYASYNDKYGLNNRTIYLIDKDGVVRYVNLAFKAGDKKDYDTLRAELEKLK
ncbi:MAG TPA: peroxiredoxin [Pyrinomonadaceae bacterium]|nr:peroxiredoxin [Pyrinomonadaceae bacterium]